MTERTGRSTLLADLADEGEYLEALVSRAEVDLMTPTPAPGWTIAHQIGHLHWSDLTTIRAITDPAAFAVTAQQFRADPRGMVDSTAQAQATHPPPELMRRWRAGRAELISLLETIPSGSKIPWFGPSMGAGSVGSARIMETWAHGVDISDALQLPPAATPRLRQVAELGVRTRDFAYSVHRRQPPTRPFRVELDGPDGELWTWGSDESDDRVAGPALDFCLLVTQRRHRADLDLQLHGAARDWAPIAQAFAGPPGSGRRPAGG